MCKEVITTYISQSGASKHTATLYGNTPYGDYLRLKEHYTQLEIDSLLEGFKSIGVHFIPKSKKVIKKFKQVLFNSNFLKDKQKECGSLTCVYCGKPNLIIYKCNEKKKLSKMATADHFFPKVLGGGAFDYENLVVSCHNCNRTKGEQIWDVDTLKHIGFYGDEFILKQILLNKIITNDTKENNN